MATALTIQTLELNMTEDFEEGKLHKPAKGVWLAIQRMGLFVGLQVVLDLSYDIKFTKKAEVKRKIIENGGIISYIITRKFQTDKLQQCCVMMKKEKESKRVCSSFSRRMKRIRLRVTKSLPGSVDITMKLDYSVVHRENEILQDCLHEHLERISWNERKTLAQKGDELEKVRKQLVEITELQTLVNSRRYRESFNVVFDIRSARDTNTACLTKTSRAQTWLKAEKDKFSSKNMFNSRRCDTSNEFEYLTFHSQVSTPAMHIIAYDEDREMYNGNDTNIDRDHEKKETTQKTTNCANNTMLTQGRFRHMTALPTTRHDGNPHHFALPLRPMTVPRSRSRRELEQASRLNLGKGKTTCGGRVDLNVNRTTRCEKLLQLRLENQDLQEKIRNFVNGLNTFSRQSEVAHILSY